MRTKIFTAAIFFLATILMAGCEVEPMPEQDPCEVNPGSTLRFSNLIYQFDEKGQILYVTTDDSPYFSGGLGSSYRLYNYAGHNVYTEMSLNNGAVFEWDSLTCVDLYDCVYTYYRSDEPCPITGQYEPCSVPMTLRDKTNYAETYGDILCHYSFPTRLDSVVSPNFTQRFYYTSGLPTHMTEWDSNGDSVFTEFYGIDQEGRWLEYEKVNHLTGHITYIQYGRDIDGRVTMVSVGTGLPPITIIDYPAKHTGCGEGPRLLDPINFHRFPYMQLPYIGLPW